jgi:hypothetical protein
MSFIYEENGRCHFQNRLQKGLQQVKGSSCCKLCRHIRFFTQQWCDCIAQFIQGGSPRIHVNDNIGHYFQTSIGFRQEVPLSPLLFNIVVDMLAIIIARGKRMAWFVD